MQWLRATQGMQTMNIVEMIKEGLRIARTARTLWLYGFFVGFWATVHYSNKGHLPGVPANAQVSPPAFPGATALLAIAVPVLIAAVVFMYFVSEGALIEGVAKLRQAKSPTVREGWYGGLAHWGVLLRIAIIYFATSVGSLLALSVPILLALKLTTTLAVVFGIPIVILAAPWLLTLYMWQAFAARIAVIENRGAVDAIGKARLFLHGRLMHGVKLIVAALLGQLIVVLVGAAGLVVAGLFGVAVLKLLGTAHATVPVLALGAIVLLPAAFILVAISGTTQSSIWTSGYLTQEQQ